MADNYTSHLRRLWCSGHVCDIGRVEFFLLKLIVVNFLHSSPCNSFVPDLRRYTDIIRWLNMKHIWAQEMRILYWENKFPTPLFCSNFYVLEMEVTALNLKIVLLLSILTVSVEIDILDVPNGVCFVYQMVFIFFSGKCSAFLSWRTLWQSWIVRRLSALTACTQSTCVCEFVFWTKRGNCSDNKHLFRVLLLSICMDLLSCV